MLCGFQTNNNQTTLRPLGDNVIHWAGPQNDTTVIVIRLSQDIYGTFTFNSEGSGKTLGTREK